MKRNPNQAQSMTILCWAAFLLHAILISDGVAQKVVKKNPNVLETTSRFASADSTLFLEGAQLTLPDKIWKYAYHPPTRTLLVHCGKKEKKQSIVLYDLAKHQTRWTLKSKAVISTLKEKAAILRFYEPKNPKKKDAHLLKDVFLVLEEKATTQQYLQSKIIDATNGRSLRKGEVGLWPPKREDLYLSLAEDYSGIHILTGTVLWRRRGIESDGIRRVFEADSGWVYVAGNGLQAFNLRSDKTWAFKTSTSRKAIGKELAKATAIATIGVLTSGLTGFYLIPGWNPDMAHNLCSSPLYIQGRIYFAARDNFFCFDRPTGKLIWQTKLKQEFGTLAVYSAGPDMAVIGAGWRYYKLNVLKAEPPAVQLFDKNSGKPAAFFSSDSNDVALDFLWTAQDAYFLTSSHLYRLDHKLNVLGVLDASATWGRFIRIMDADQSIILRTGNGILALNPASLDSVWYKYLGPEKLNIELSPKLKWVEGAAALVAKSLERKGQWRQDNITWLLGSNGLVAVDLKNAGQVLMEIPFRGTNYEITDEGILFTFDENRLSLVNLNKIERRTPAMPQQ